jgi:tRNA A-37 threonylcarbamoyl transferase component Bud32
VIQRVTTTVEPDGSLFTLPNQFKPHMFALKNPDRELWLHCDEAKERVAWVSAIRESQTVLKGGPSNQALENHQQWSFDFKELELSEKVAEGSFGDVFKGKLWGTKVAIKTLKQLDQSDESILEDLKQEVRILSQLRHPNVVLYIGACIKPPDTCIVTEWCSRGSLYDALHDPKIHFTCKMMIDMSIGIAQGMNYLHYLEKPIIHRDLKSYNILLDKSFQVKVADFGLSFSSKKKARTKPLAADHKDTKTLQTTADLPNDIFGTPEWMAPEVMQGEHYDEKIDVYSFGVLLTELLTRQKPFSDQFKIKCYQDVFDQVLDNGAVPTIPEWSTRFIKPLVVSCLSHEPSRRPSFNDIILYLSEFLQLDENDFFLQFDIPRIMHLLADEKYQFQALGAAELAKLAFQEKFRTDEVVPEWATAGPTKDAAIDGRPYSFKDLSPDTMEKLLVTLAQLVDNKRSLVQLSACRALTCILSLLTEDNRKQYTMLVVKAHVLKHSCSIFLKDSQSLKVAASNLILAIVTVVPEAETFVGLMNQEVKILTSVISKERNVMHTAVQQKEETLRTLQGVEESINRSTLHGPAREKVAEEVKQNLQGLLQKRGAPPLKLAERPVSMRAQPPPIPASVKKSTKIQTNEKVSRS